MLDGMEWSNAAPRAQRGGLKLFVALGVVALGVAYLIATSLQPNMVYYLKVSELQARGAQAASERVRVAGYVVPGSIQRGPGGATPLRFTVEDQGARMDVLYPRGIVPDIFGDEIEVVVEGRYNGDGVFVADTLLAKCPSRFEAELQPGAVSQQPG